MGQTPLPSLHYFLGAAYADYSGQGWQTPSPTATSRTGVPLTAGGQPDYLGIATGKETSQALTVDHPVTLQSRGGSADQITLASGVTTYTVTSSVPQATAEQLRAAGTAYPASLAPYLAKPNVPARIAQLARQWAARAPPTPTIRPWPSRRSCGASPTPSTSRRRPPPDCALRAAGIRGTQHHR